MDQDNSPARQRWEGVYNDLDENGVEMSRESRRHRSKDRSSKSTRREEKHHKSRDRERSKASDVSKEREKERVSSRDRKKEDRDDRDKDRTREKAKEKYNDLDKYKDKDHERDREQKDHGKEKERSKETELDKNSERGRDKDRSRDKAKDKDKEKEKDQERDNRAKDRERDKEREKHKGRDKDREHERDREQDKLEKERGKDRTRNKERDANLSKERSNDRDKVNRKQHDESHGKSKDLGKDEKLRSDGEGTHYRKETKKEIDLQIREDNIKNPKLDENADIELGGSHRDASDLGERISKMKEERLKKKSEGSDDILSWVSKSRKLEEKRNAEKEKALQLSKVFEEQDNINQGDSEDEAATQHNDHVLSGVKVLHGIDKVIEGGAVVLTLKDQSILANGDVNEDVDMLENVEIGEQKQRDEAYKSAKKRTGIYEDKFSDDFGSEKKMLPQYDDPVADEGVTLDAAGRFSGEAEKKLEELRRRIGGVNNTSHVEDLNSSGKTSSDYYTQEEMLQFKKPKKKKSLRKKDKLDLDALEAEAVSAGLGIGDLGSRNDGKRQAVKEEQDKSEAEKRSNAYQSAYARADEASKALRLEQSTTMQPIEEDDQVFGDDDEDLRKSLERARKLALEKQHTLVASGPQAIALLAASAGKSSTADDENPVSGESQENKVVFTEMEEFVWGLQLDEEAHKPASEDVFMEEDEEPKASVEKQKDEDGGWTEIQDNGNDITPPDKEEQIALDETIHEVPVGKGLSGALHLLKERGDLKESVEWGGRNMDKKKSKLVGIYENDSTKKEIRIERTDEYGRILTPKEAFRLLSHKFHGKGPGKMKLEKRMREYEEELKVKRMKNADTPSLSVERMREAQAQLKTPYLVLSGNIKPGQTSDPRSGFATVEKEFPGGLTPMLGDRKVEHFLGINRKSGPGDMGPPKKPKS